MRQIAGMRDLRHWDRLRVLGLYAQQHRRDRYYHAIYMWKILKNQVSNPYLLALQPYATESNHK